MNVSESLAGFKDVVGDNYVVADQDVLDAYGQTTFQTSAAILLIVRPGSVAELQACLNVAAQHGLSVYTLSTGLNVGYGAKVPSRDGCVLLELKRLNRIVDFSEDLAYVTVEPGVTQQQLYNFLQSKKSRLRMDVTGAFVNHSLVGNLAERGFGHTEQADHFAHIGGMEVMLASGDLIRTGFGRFSNAKSTGLYRWGVGPVLDGIFTQSNFGIITQITIWLAPQPECTLNFFFDVPSYEDIEELVECLRPLRLDGTIDCGLHIGNDYRVISSIMTYPWKRLGGRTPMNRDDLNSLAKEWGFGAWNGSGALYGSRQQVRLAARKIKRQLKGKVKKLRFIDDRLLALAERFQHVYYKLTGENLPQLLKVLKPVYDMTRGVPNEGVVSSVYWRKPSGTDQSGDANADRCGLMWLAPIIPATGKDVMTMWGIVEPVMLGYGFEPGITCTLISGRAIDVVISINYDRDVAGEDQKAMQCHDELLAQLSSAGYYPYRLGRQSQGKLANSDVAYDALLHRIKSSLDPQGLLSPGHYQ